MKRSIVSPGFVKRTLAKLLKLDQQLGIVVDGNVASKAIAVGKYVNLINSTIAGKPDGIYVATGAVSSGGTVTAADISGNAVSDGVTNELSERIAKKTGLLTSTHGTLTNWSRVDMSGNVVSFTMQILTTSAVSAWTEIAVVPSGFRPSVSLNFDVVTRFGNSSFKSVQLQILDTGIVRCSEDIPNNTSFGCSVTYII